VTAKKLNTPRGHRSKFHERPQGRHGGQKAHQVGDRAAGPEICSEHF
jgi:hypothetical protein